MKFKFNPITGVLDLVLSDSYISGKWLLLDASNDPLTGELVITPASGDIALHANKDIKLKSGQKLIWDGD